ncbi:hypothetical protein [Christiangramia forsetii]|uniref:Secreted protein n=2 Tax=Christiangramia forsetii TaxID=411153 RepID=A0M620_CHRFK|nr:hypothetical protein [Christiangramia forsetii]GGG31612.1 hypothetical protein GCM10011532_13890 [Christiangramia forsetii]CAL68065.1 secreted protein [Christiangramia forsetii KT0803]
MKLLFAIFPILISFHSYSQETVGYAITENNERIDFYQNVEKRSKLAYNHVISGDVSMTGQFIFYLDKKNEFRKIPQKKIKELNYGLKRFLTLPLSWSMDRIHEVIAENDKYLLTQYYFNGVNYLYVFDKSNMKYVEKKISHSYKVKKDSKNFERYIKPYFSNCPELLKKIKFNIENIKYRSNAAYKDNSEYADNYLFNSISNFQCK